jgi:hypothetical protein
MPILQTMSMIRYGLYNLMKENTQKSRSVIEKHSQTLPLQAEINAPG